MSLTLLSKTVDEILKLLDSMAAPIQLVPLLPLKAQLLCSLTELSLRWRGTIVVMQTIVPRHSTFYISL